ncbi:MAG: CARDB domain-containing protein [Patescibacteria group bacterium]
MAKKTLTRTKTRVTTKTLTLVALGFVAAAALYGVVVTQKKGIVSIRYPQPYTTPITKPYTNPYTSPYTPPTPKPVLPDLTFMNSTVTMLGAGGGLYPFLGVLIKNDTEIIKPQGRSMPAFMIYVYINNSRSPLTLSSTSSKRATTETELLNKINLSDYIGQTIKVKFVIDPGNYVSESNERNNTMEQTITVPKTSNFQFTGTKVY